MLEAIAIFLLGTALLAASGIALGLAGLAMGVLDEAVKLIADVARS